MTNGEITVYDSMNGVGVRMTPLAEYLRLQTPCEIHVVRLATPFQQGAETGISIASGRAVGSQIRNQASFDRKTL